MYDELVKRLREPCQYENYILCNEAADVIEELSKRVPPVPHGRLIDADALCNRLLTAWDTADKEKKTLISAVVADVVTPIVVGTPTIIPAEEEEK